MSFSDGFKAWTVGASRPGFLCEEPKVLFKRGGDRGKKWEWGGQTKNSLLLGKVLLTFSTLIWITGIAIIPLLPYDLLTRAWLAGAFIVIGEIIFYASVILLGKEMVKKYGRYLKPGCWIKKRKP